MTTPSVHQSAAESLALAETYKATGNLPAAEAALSQILGEFPDCAPACHSLGLIAFERGNLPLALQWMAKAITLNGSVGLYHRNLGELCRRLGRLEEAVHAGRKATELTPLDLDAHYNLGLALSNSGQWYEAIASFKNALALHAGHGTSWNALGVALERSGQRLNAERAYTRAVQLNPEHAEAQLNLGILFKKQGRLQDAQRCFEQVHTTAPELATTLGVSVKTTVDPIHSPKIGMRDTGSVRGRGVFAERGFAAGEIIETSAVVLLQTPFETLPPEIKTICFNWGALCGIGSVQALALGYGSLYNHNNPANTRYEAVPENLALKFIAVRDIRSGEELTINYNAAVGRENQVDNNWFDRMNVTLIATAT